MAARVDNNDDDEANVRGEERAREVDRIRSDLDTVRRLRLTVDMLSINVLVSRKLAICPITTSKARTDEKQFERRGGGGGGGKGGSNNNNYNYNNEWKKKILFFPFTLFKAREKKLERMSKAN